MLENFRKTYSKGKWTFLTMSRFSNFLYQQKQELHCSTYHAEFNKMPATFYRGLKFLCNLEKFGFNFS